MAGERLSPRGGAGLHALDPEIAACLRRWRSGIEREASASRLDGLLRPRLIRYFASHGHAHEEAEDLVQRTLLRVFQGMAALREPESFEAWLFVVARNVRMTALRDRVREAATFARGAEPETDPPAQETPLDEAADARRRLAALGRALATLPPQQRRCLVLRTRDDLSYLEIARLLGLSVLTVRNHLASGRRELRRRLGESAGEESE